jgi:hypothetical protein
MSVGWDGCTAVADSMSVKIGIIGQDQCPAGWDAVLHPKTKRLRRESEAFQVSAFSETYR